MLSLSPAAWLTSRRSLLWLILGLALAARLGLVVAVGDRALEYEFRTLAENLLAGHGYAYWSEAADGTLTTYPLEAPSRTFASAYMPPGYPYFLWAVGSVVGTAPGGVVAIEVVQTLLGAGCCWLVFALGRLWFSEETGLLAAAGFALYPVLAVVPAQISAINAYLLAFLATFWLLARAHESGRVAVYAAAGLAFGLTTLVRAQFIVFIPMAAAWTLLAPSTKPWRTRLLGGAVLLAVATAALVPWTVRNAEVLGTATPLTTSGGHNLWQAYGPLATGTHSAYVHPPAPFPDDLLADLDAVRRDAFLEVRLDSVYGARARAALAADPARAVRLAVKKLGLYWVHFGASDIRYPGASSPAFWLPWLVTLPFFLVGLWVSVRRRWRLHVLLYVYLAAQTAIAVAFFVLPRYRIEILPVVILFAAEGMRGAWIRWRTPAPARP